MNEKGNKILALLTILFITTLMITGIFYVYLNNESPIIEPVIEEPQLNLMDSSLKERYLINKSINIDYIGNIAFESGLIDLPFVQANSVYKPNGELYTFYTEKGELVSDPIGYTGNDVYLWTNWKTGEYDYSSDGGSVFLDYRNDLSDQNLIIYGHHYNRNFDPNGKKAFTKLDLLLKDEYYEENKYIDLILDNEIRKYVIANVFIIDIEDDIETQVVRTNINKDFSGNYDPNFFNTYISTLNRLSLYKTDISLEKDDKLLTLITCITGEELVRQVIVCKMIDQIIYD